MNNVCFASLEEVHDLAAQIDVEALLIDKVLENLLARLVRGLVVHGAEDAGESGHDVGVEGDSCEDQEDRCHHLSLIGRRDIAITHRANGDDGPVASCNVPRSHGSVINAKPIDPANHVLLLREQRHDGKGATDYMQ